ncbi:hypothetical protein QW131_25370 [Roseibium salinum]|nr:hypothetical protein [Roseibium salinum]
MFPGPGRPCSAKTLESFFRPVFFRNFEVGTLYVNIDPFEGGPEEVSACETICRDHFPNVVARKPETPHFTKAVRWLWRQPRAEWCFHLEDDWILNREVRAEEFRQSMKTNVRQVSLMTKEKNWGYRSPYHYEPSRLKILGRDFGKKASTGSGRSSRQARVSSAAISRRAVQS